MFPAKGIKACCDYQKMQQCTKKNVLHITILTFGRFQFSLREPEHRLVDLLLSYISAINKSETEYVWSWPFGQGEVERDQEPPEKLPIGQSITPKVGQIGLLKFGSYLQEDPDL